MPSFPTANAKNFGRIIDLTTNEKYVFDWNPTEISESVSANYSRQEIPGLSHSRSQFINTNNKEYGFTLVLDAAVHGGPVAVEKAKQFLLSCMYPRASRRIDGAGAPKVMFILPGAIRSKGFIESVDVTMTLFYADTKLRKFSADVKFVEEPDKRLTSELVRRTSNASRKIGGFIDFRNMTVDGIGPVSLGGVGPFEINGKFAGE